MLRHASMTLQHINSKNPYQIQNEINKMIHLFKVNIQLIIKGKQRINI